MRKKFYSLVALFLSFTVLSTQENNINKEKSSGRYSFIAEAGGPGIAFSANIDKRFANTNIGWGGRIGPGFVSSAYNRNFLNLFSQK